MRSILPWPILPLPQLRQTTYLGPMTNSKTFTVSKQSNEHSPSSGARTSSTAFGRFLIGITVVRTDLKTVELREDRQLCLGPTRC